MGISLKDGLTESHKKAARLMGITDDQMYAKLLKLQPGYIYDVAIIIPVYNCEKYILEAVLSALNQTHESVEVIVVNDGSTDKTHELLCGVEGITYLIKPNGGTASALNLGIRNANTNWVHWLSADDVLHPEAISRMVDEISITPNPRNYIYYTDYDIIDENSGRIGEFLEPLHRNFGSKNERFQELMGNFYGNGSTTMIHRSMIEQMGWFDESLPHSEDYDFWLKCMKNGMDLKHLPFKTISYRMHSGQMTNKVGGQLNDKIRSRYR